MSDKTGIEWTESTWNPITGCSKVSQGCKNCYAERGWARLSKIGGNVYTGRSFTDVMCHPERLDQPLHWKAPRRIFVNSMSDLFHESVPDEFVLLVFDIMRRCSFDGGADRVHVFQVLTKRPERMLAFAKRLRFSNLANDVAGECALYLADDDRRPIVLKNVWLGVSVEDQATADERIPVLLQIPAVTRWISAEPLLGPISFRWALWEPIKRDRPTGHLDGLKRLDWIVVGGESGPKARPMHPDWVRSLRDECQAASVPFFFKQWGEWHPGCSYYSEYDDTRDAAIDAPHKLITIGGALWDPEFDGQPPLSTWIMHRTGKKTAGREIDGRTWDGYPDQDAAAAP